MRKLWPIAMVLVLAVAVGPLQAQVSLTSFNGGSSSKQNAANAAPFTSVGITQMMPKFNTGQALGSTPNNPRTLNFSKMLPSFSFLTNRWPLNVSNVQAPPPQVYIPGIPKK